MPTIATIGPYRFYFFSNESGEPAHVHVRRDHATAKLWLQPVVIAAASNFGIPELRRIERIVRVRRGLFLERWNAHFESL